MLIIWCGLEVVAVEDTDELTNNSFNLFTIVRYMMRLLFYCPIIARLLPNLPNLPNECERLFYAPFMCHTRHLCAI